MLRSTGFQNLFSFCTCCLVSGFRLINSQKIYLSLPDSRHRICLKNASGKKPSTFLGKGILLYQESLASGICHAALVKTGQTQGNLIPFPLEEKRLRKQIKASCSVEGRRLSLILCLISISKLTFPVLLVGEVKSPPEQIWVWGSLHKRLLLFFVPCGFAVGSKGNLVFKWLDLG